MNVPHETLATYMSLLQKWNQTINLVSPKDLEHLWERHVLDSAQLIKFIQADDRVVDVGSGAGLPGIILAIMGIKYITLVEADKRKAAFLLQASKLAMHDIIILNKRVENLSLECDILTCRGFASIVNTLELCKHIVVKKKFLFLKGAQVHKEIDAAKILWDFEYNIKPSITNKTGYVVELIMS